MTKKSGFVIVSLVIFSVVISGCKMPASKAPETPTGEMKTTPIVIKTDAPANTTQTDIAQTAVPTEEEITQAPGEETTTPPTNTPMPTSAIPVPTITRPAEYTVQAGEYPYCLARRFNVALADLLEVNNFGEDPDLSIGQVILIPQNSTWDGPGRELNPHPDIYTVDPGDTIYSIACYYGDVSPEAIIAVNELEEPYDLTVGQTLQIP